MKCRLPFCASVALIAFASPVFAQAPAAKIDAGDTAWMIAATALVLMMTLPGLALFYCGMVRKRNVLATMAQSVAAVCLVSILWALLGYTLSFSAMRPHSAISNARCCAASAWTVSVRSPRRSPRACS